MDSDIRQRLAIAAKKLNTNPGSTPTIISENSTLPTARKHKHRKIRWGWQVTTCFVIGFAILAALGFTQIAQKQSGSPLIHVIPESIKSSVAFPVYFPEQSKLPSGYRLDKESFNTNGQVVVYSVNYGSGQKIAFSVQKKPNADELAAFYTNRIPLRTEIKVPLGELAISALNNQTFASLPSKSTWIIITAPLDTDKTKLSAVIESLRK